MLAGLESRRCKFEVGEHRSCNDDCIDPGIQDQCLRISHYVSAGVAAGSQSAPVRLAVSNADQRGIGQLSNVPSDVRTPISVTYYSDPDIAHGRTLRRAGTPITVAPAGTSLVTT